MIKGFEKQTSQLTEEEENVIVPLLVDTLGRCKEKRSALTNKRMLKLLGDIGIHSSEPRLRKMINHIRITGRLTGLIATSCGYYTTNIKDEVNDYIESLIGREEAIRQVRESFEHQLKTLSYG